MSWNAKLVAATLAFIPGLVVGPVAGEAQFVKITSPERGIVVHPGDRFTITVDATPFAFRGIMLALGWGGSRSGPPYRITAEVPSDWPSGVQRVTALGVPTSGLKDVDEKNAIEDSIELDIERSASPNRLTFRLLGQYNIQGPFGRIGETRSSLLTGIFGDGTEAELSSSKLNRYESSDPSVATVSSDGVVRAIGPGSATITVKNGSATAAVSVTVLDKR